MIIFWMNVEHSFKFFILKFYGIFSKICQYSCAISSSFSLKAHGCVLTDPLIGSHILRKKQYLVLQTINWIFLRVDSDFHCHNQMNYSIPILEKGMSLVQARNVLNAFTIFGHPSSSIRSSTPLSLF